MSDVYVLELAGDDDRFAVAEAAAAALDPRVVAPGLAVARALDAGRARGLAFTRRASSLLGRTDASVESAVALLDAASIERSGTVAVRARDVRRSADVDTRRAERELGRVLVDRGFEVDLDDPDHELRTLFAAPAKEDESGGTAPESVDDGTDATPGQTVPPDGAPDDVVPDEARAGVCLLGWLDLETRRDYGERAPTDRPFFQPGSMDPLLARALVNVAGARPGATLLDPMCGTGGVLVEAGLVGARVLGVDAQSKMVRGARENLERYLGDGFALLRGDAARLPVRDDAVDAVVFDAPYGRQSKIDAADVETLVAGALAEARRVAPRAVVVGDRSWEAAAREAGWTVEATFERRVHRSLTRHVLVLDGRGDGDGNADGPFDALG